MQLVVEDALELVGLATHSEHVPLAVEILVVEAAEGGNLPEEGARARWLRQVSDAEDGAAVGTIEPPCPLLIPVVLAQTPLLTRRVLVSQDGEALGVPREARA